LIAGGSFGHVRVIQLPTLINDAISTPEHETISLKVVLHWRAHLVGITSAIYVDSQNLILTGSRDSNVRLWSMTGQHVGTFGDQIWNFSDPSLGKLPRDLQQEMDVETRAKESSNKHDAKLKKQIIDTWTQAFPDPDAESPIENVSANSVELLKNRAIKAHVASMYKINWIREKNKEDYKINPELVTVKSKKVN
jgi:hypothetical protein